MQSTCSHSSNKPASRCQNIKNTFITSELAPVPSVTRNADSRRASLTEAKTKRQGAPIKPFRMEACRTTTNIKQHQASHPEKQSNINPSTTATAQRGILSQSDSGRQTEAPDDNSENAADASVRTVTSKRCRKTIASAIAIAVPQIRLVVRSVSARIFE